MITDIPGSDMRRSAVISIQILTSLVASAPFTWNCVSDINACVVGSWDSTAVSALQGDDLSEEEAMALAMQVLSLSCVHRHQSTCLLLLPAHLPCPAGLKRAFWLYSTNAFFIQTAAVRLISYTLLFVSPHCLTLLKQTLDRNRGVQASLADKEKAAPGPARPSAWLSAAQTASAHQGAGLRNATGEYDCFLNVIIHHPVPLALWLLPQCCHAMASRCLPGQQSSNWLQHSCRCGSLSC